MKEYIFIDENTKKIVDSKDWYCAGAEARGYAQGLSKLSKHNIIAYLKVAGQD